MSDEMKRFQKIAGYHVSTMKLIDLLEPLSICGSQIEMEDLSNSTGEDHYPGGNGYGHLQSAIRYILKSKRMLWQRPKGSAHLVCLDDGEKLDHCKRERKLIHRRSKRTMQKLATVDTGKLADKQKSEHLALTAGMGALAVFSSTTTQDKMIADAAYRPISIGKALEMMK